MPVYSPCNPASHYRARGVPHHKVKCNYRGVGVSRVYLYFYHLSYEYLCCALITVRRKGTCIAQADGSKLPTTHDDNLHTTLAQLPLFTRTPAICWIFSPSISKRADFCCAVSKLPELQRLLRSRSYARPTVLAWHEGNWTSLVNTKSTGGTLAAGDRITIRMQDALLLTTISLKCSSPSSAP